MSKDLRLIPGEEPFAASAEGAKKARSAAVKRRTNREPGVVFSLRTHQTVLLRPVACTAGRERIGGGRVNKAARRRRRGNREYGGCQ